MKEPATQTKAPKEASTIAVSPRNKPLFSSRPTSHPILRLQRTIGNQAIQRYIQAKLIVGAANDEYEQEAERVAERVMSTPTLTSAGTDGASIQRRTSEEKEVTQMKPLATSITRLVQRAPSDPKGSFEPGSDFEARLSGSGGGNPLPASTRAFMEPRFGVDFSGVRLHTGSEAAQLNRAVNAQAFAHGPDIYLGEGQNNLEMGSGKQLLAHELTHVVQQRGAVDQDAERSASAALAREGKSAISAEPTPTLRRFVGEEHRFLGEAGSGGMTTEILAGNGAAMTRLSYGDVVAMAGDFFEDIGQMLFLSKSPSGRDELLWARWKALSSKSKATEPNVPDTVKKSVMDRYYTLAARNISHFSAGGTASSAYDQAHTFALDEAYLSGYDNKPDYWNEAVAREAFSNHYLTDMFSAGHVRTERAAIKAWYSSMFPNSVDQFVIYMARRMRQHLGNVHYILDIFGNLILPSQSDLENRIRSIGGPAVSAFSLGDVVSLAFHNRDNEGLNVVADVDETGKAVKTYWEATGDANLWKSTQTANMAIAAVKASVADLKFMRAEGQTAPRVGVYSTSYNASLKKVLPYKALSFVPREDITKGNVAMDWHWGSFNSEMRAAVDKAIKEDVADALKGKADEQTDANVKDALNDFVQRLKLLGIQAIEAAIGKPAGP